MRDPELGLWRWKEAILFSLFVIAIDDSKIPLPNRSENTGMKTLFLFFSGGIQCEMKRLTKATMMSFLKRSIL